MIESIVFFLVSATFVDLVGYWLHRWAHSPSSPLHRPHMTHHVRNYPPGRFFSQRYERSGSDSLALWFAPFGVVYVALILLLGLPHPIAMIAGGATVAVLSSVLHDLSHVGGSVAWRWRIFRAGALHHRTHHSKMRRNYGIILSCWDRLFGTRWRGRAGRPLPRFPSR